MNLYESVKEIIKEHKTATVFSVGSLAYSAVELLWRGHTHWTMAVAGGFCFCIITEIERRFPHIKFLYKCVLGSLSITAVELIFGVIFNVLLHKNVWDYSNIKFNLFGQICVLYTVLWGFLTALAIPLSKKLIYALQK
ncbi:MAG: hypothetical protein U0M42_07885 [Acutalibacteraceae bacterium]|nr:hypothetical protein [Acutalibacteraceae bacterium]